jgi:hypothetical protein
MDRAKPIKDPTARNLLVLIRQGRLDLIGVLADVVEESGDPRCHELRQLLAFRDDLARKATGQPWLGPGPPPKPWEVTVVLHDCLRCQVGQLFSRRWPRLPYAEAARLMGLPGAS